MYNQSECTTKVNKDKYMKCRKQEIQCRIYSPDLGSSLFRLEQVRKFVSKDSAGLCIYMYFFSWCEQVAMVKANGTSLL